MVLMASLLPLEDFLAAFCMSILGSLSKLTDRPTQKDVSGESNCSMTDLDGKTSKLCTDLYLYKKTVDFFLAMCCFSEHAHKTCEIFDFTFPVCDILWCFSFFPIVSLVTEIKKL